MVGEFGKSVYETGAEDDGLIVVETRILTVACGGLRYDQPPGRRVNEVTSCFVRLDQGFNCVPQRVVAKASLLKIIFALLLPEANRRVKNLFEVFPVLVGHMKSLRQADAS